VSPDSLWFGLEQPESLKSSSQLFQVGRVSRCLTHLGKMERHPDIKKLVAPRAPNKKQAGARNESSTASAARLQEHMENGTPHPAPS
jgi:hypothetical protein